MADSVVAMFLAACALAAFAQPAIATDPFEVAVDLPNCDGATILSTPADWKAINDPEKSTFCVLPGDYRAAGLIRLTASGTRVQPRVIRYYNPSSEGAPTHPALQATSDRAIVHGFELRKANYWVLDHLSLLNPVPDLTLLNRTLNLRNSSNNVFQDLLVEGGLEAVTYYFRSEWNVFQRNVVRDTLLAPHRDAACMVIKPPPGGVIRGNRFVSNELYDCTDSLTFHIDETSVGASLPGTIVANNDMYLTPSMYSDCHGRLDPAGPCAGAEGRSDIKVGGLDATEEGRFYIVRNRYWGARKTDPLVGGGGSWGTGLDIGGGYGGAKHVVIEDNLIFDVARGVELEGAEGVIFRHNLIHSVYPGFQGTGVAVVFGDSAKERGNTFSHNLVSGAVKPYTVRGADNTVTCNAFLGVQRQGYIRFTQNLKMERNAYWGAPPFPGQAGDLVGAADEARALEFCFDRRLLTGPERVCLSRGRMTQQSPLPEGCEIPGPRTR